MAELKAQVNFRPGLRNISCFGGYALAERRNMGHASSETTVKMVASSELAGGLKDRGIVVQYEHRIMIVVTLA